MEYEIVIGLEIHSELATKSKIYCSCTTEFGGIPNTHCCPVCTGMPGVLPVLNKNVVEYAAKAGLAMNCKILDFSKQDRKNYFYPDLPKAYQVSQFDLPLCVKGYIDIDLNDKKKRVGITRIHIEEDAGKLIHDEWETGSLIDYNRCGVPLIEIVTEPDMRSAEDARVFMESVRSILKYTEVSDCKMQEGSLRADVNLSVRIAGEKELGTRTEMKNLNSIRSITRAIESEAKRQIDIIESGGSIEQETRRWDDEKGLSYSMRSKEEAHDYRYFPEPDLAPVIIDANWLDRIKSTLPELPDERKKRYIDQYKIPGYDAKIITASRETADFFEEAVGLSNNAKAVSNWIMGDLMNLMKNSECEEIPFSPSHLANLIKLIENGVISGKIAKTVFKKMFETADEPERIVEREGLKVVNDEGQLNNIVSAVVKSNPKSVEDYRNGKKKAIGFLVGQVMKETKGKADPQMVNKLLKDELES